jgi:heme-degrading monooxygenase HmoA
MAPQYTFAPTKENAYPEEAIRLAERMIEMAAQQPGFLGIESAREHGRFGITVSYWSGEESIAKRKANSEHKVAKKADQNLWYSGHHLRVANVRRYYGSSTE